MIGKDYADNLGNQENIAIKLRLGTVTGIISNYCLTRCPLSNTKCCINLTPEFSVWQLAPMVLYQPQIFNTLLQMDAAFCLELIKMRILRRHYDRPCPLWTPTGCILAPELRPDICNHFMCSSFKRDVMPVLANTAQWNEYRAQLVNINRLRRASGLEQLVMTAVFNRVRELLDTDDFPADYITRKYPLFPYLRTTLEKTLLEYRPLYEQTLRRIKNINGEDRKITVTLEGWTTHPTLAVNGNLKSNSFETTMLGKSYT
ncbi:MAG: hypothetical protein H0Z39_09870 [Peptococcaceae bacterium]|nr:hypothetical protein [Peptococcaceae bacterium]